MGGVEVSWVLTGWATVVRVAGDVGAVDVAGVGAELRAAWAGAVAGGVVVLDLRDVALLSSHGARLVNRFVAGCARGRVRVCLVLDPGGAAYRVLRITGVSERVPVFADPEAAGAAVGRVVSGR
ncbi:STAS domain-containing protein [Actinokineospora cianjurensis]|uniref:Anti-anti-sigma factor n=1 Tax=Actinokineospora cianjurensis TaxID=585224 RepID=A0A421BCB1_9PSEU|nr:STAS domain-containing protein [Actinokineospora cianjurensis]RLK62014.1 anti-anti-sigma factor [Actinokineospora cianjurensis]